MKSTGQGIRILLKRRRDILSIVLTLLDINGKPRGITMTIIHMC